MKQVTLLSVLETKEMYDIIILALSKGQNLCPSMRAKKSEEHHPYSVLIFI